MPLLTENQRINASLAAKAENIASHLAAAAHAGNQLVQVALDLDDEALTDWLNSQPPADTLALFTAHGELGAALNGAIAVASAVLTESGIPAPSAAVDVRSVPEKLAEQYRAIELTEEGWQVIQLDRPPVPDAEIIEE